MESDYGKAGLLMLGYTQAYLRRRSDRRHSGKIVLGPEAIGTVMAPDGKIHWAYQEYGEAERSAGPDYPPPWTFVEYECEHDRCRSLGSGTKCYEDQFDA